MSRLLQIAFSRLHAALYRLLRGRLPASGNLLILTTTGRKSGKPRRLPLNYARDGERYVLIASNGGSDAPPSWWLNLQAHGPASIEIRGETRRVSAAEADEADRDRLWSQMTAIYSGYDKYEAKTSRRIPVVLLTAVDG